MFRRYVSLLVMAGFFASQLAEFPHTHGSAIPADEQERHDASPHFHWFSLAEHKHDHPHPHRNQLPHDGSPCAPGVATDSFGNHDADAIYLPLGSITPSHSRGVDSTLRFAQLLSEHSLLAALGGQQAPCEEAMLWRPPDAALDGSKLFLTLRTLRI